MINRAHAQITIVTSPIDDDGDDSQDDGGFGSYFTENSK